MNEVWSKKYGTNPKEGIHCFLQRYVPDYQRSQIERYKSLFFKKYGKPAKSKNWVNSINTRFKLFRTFIIKKEYLDETEPRTNRTIL